MITWVIFVVAAIVTILTFGGVLSLWVGAPAILIVVATLIGYFARRSGPKGPG